MEAPNTQEAEGKTLEMPAAGSTEVAVVSHPGGSPGGDRIPFTTSDLVWARVNRDWWPGKVCDISGPSDPTQNPYRPVPVSCFSLDTELRCNPLHLKPFVERFHQMACWRRSDSFFAALESALHELGKCLELQSACPCVPEEERSELWKYSWTNPGVSNYSAAEFLKLARDVAVDSSTVDPLERTRVRAWAVAYQRGCTYADANTWHHRKKIEEITDDTDLVTSALPHERPRRRKRRSAAVSNGDVQSMNDGDMGLGRRERKRSKYLSPPYTDLSDAYCSLLAATDKPETSRAIVIRSSSAVGDEEVGNGMATMITAFSAFDAGVESANKEVAGRDFVKVELITISDDEDSEDEKGKKKAGGDHEREEDFESKPLRVVESGEKELNPNNSNKAADSSSSSTNANSMNRKRKIRDDEAATWTTDSAVLELSFSPSHALPHEGELISEFSKYGPLIEWDVKVERQSRSARVVFARSADAEKAFNDTAGAFRQQDSTCHLHYHPLNPKNPWSLMQMPPSVPRLPLPCMKRNLEMMISIAQGAASTSGGPRPPANFVGQMQELLTMVNQVLGAPDAGTSI